MELLPQSPDSPDRFFHMRNVGDRGPIRSVVAFLSRALALSLLLVTASASAAHAAGLSESAWLPLQKPIAAPKGFREICTRYSWACSRKGQSGHTSKQLFEIANAVNLEVNRKVRQVSDRSQYGSEEVWSLPTSRGGDCEDLVLVKKMRLVESGVSGDRLLIATVLDRQRAPHAVLVLRLDAGDFVLDSLKNQIKPWHKTGYSFVRMQNPKAPNSWNAVMAGGVFNGRRSY